MSCAKTHTFCSSPKGWATRAGISAEGLGYQGGHFSGMAMTSERILLGCHPDVNPQAVLGDWDYKRTSNPASARLNRTQKLYGFNEPTATVIARHGLSPYDTVLWNIFPFHPYKEGNILSNRTPTGEELDVGIEYARILMQLIPGMKVVAIGRKSQQSKWLKLILRATRPSTSPLKSAKSC